MDEAFRQLVRQRADDRCEYCLLPQHAAPVYRFHVEHIRARQHGGSDALDNLALACPNCNHHKGPNLSAVDPLSDEVVLLFNPRTQVREEHFDATGVRITGITPIGRATASLLSFNADPQLRLREALYKRGEWP
jgi:hypothetical protein